MSGNPYKHIYFQPPVPARVRASPANSTQPQVTEPSEQLREALERSYYPQDGILPQSSSLPGSRTPQSLSPPWSPHSRGGSSTSYGDFHAGNPMSPQESAYNSRAPSPTRTAYNFGSGRMPRSPPPENLGDPLNPLPPPPGYASWARSSGPNVGRLAGPAMPVARSTTVHSSSIQNGEQARLSFSARRERELEKAQAAARKQNQQPENLASTMKRRSLVEPRDDQGMDRNRHALEPEQQKEFDKLLNELDTSYIEIKGLEAQVDEKDNELQELQARFNALERQLAQAQPSDTQGGLARSRTEGPGDYINFLRRIAQLEKDKEAYAEKLAVLLSEDDARDRLLEEAEQRAMMAESKVESLEGQVAEAQEKINLLETTPPPAQDHDYAALTRKIAALELEEESLQQQVATLKVQASQVESSNRQLAVAKSKALQAEEAARNLQKQLAEAKESQLDRQAVPGSATPPLEDVKSSPAGAFAAQNSRSLELLEEEVTLKRCWLARYWQLAVKYGVHPEVAATQCATWQELAPSGAESTMATAAAGHLPDIGVETVTRGAEEVAASLLQAESGLKNLAALKVEEAVLLAMSMEQKSRFNLVRMAPSKAKEGGELKGRFNLVESPALPEEEAEDVRFKQHWLMYFWRRAAECGLEVEVAADRLRYWQSRAASQPTAMDAVDVEDAILELHRLGLDRQIWSAIS